MEKLPFFLVAALSSWITFRAQQSGGAVLATAELPLGSRIVNAVGSYAIYLEKTFWPANLSVFYPYPHFAWDSWQVLAGGILLVVITGVTLLMRKRAAWGLVSWLWFLVALGPVIGIVQVGQQAMADRYTYLPLLGVFLMVTWLAAEIARALQIPIRVGWGVGIAVLVACLSLTAIQLPRWRDTKTLFEHACKVTSNNYVALAVVGTELARAGDYDGAIEWCRRSLAVSPAYPEAHNTLAWVYLKRGELDSAITELRAAAASGAADPQSLMVLGKALLERGQPAEAVEHLRFAATARPENVEAQYALGVALGLCGKSQEAAAAYRRVLQLKPDMVEAMNNLAWILASTDVPALRNGKEAVELSERACALTDFREPLYVGTLAAAYAAASRFQDAVQAAEKAIDLATAAGLTDVVERNRRLIEIYRAGRAVYGSP